MKERKRVIIRRGEGKMLVIVDGQNDFIREDGALHVRGVEGEQGNSDIIFGIKTIVWLFNYAVTTEDEHWENHVEFTIYGPHCVKGTEGQKYHIQLKDIYCRVNERIKKGQEPWLFGYSVGASPQFSQHIKTIREFGIKNIFTCGWAYTHCVGETAIDYARHGFNVYVIRDLCRSVPLPYGDPARMKRKLRAYEVKEINLGDIKEGGINSCIMNF